MGSDPTGLFQQGILGHSQREDRVRTQGEGGHLQARQSPSSGAESTGIFILDSQPLELSEH